MKKIILISFLISLIILNQEASAITISTSVDMSGLIPVCSGNSCNVPNGVSGIEVVTAGILKYVTLVASLIAVLFIVINGILYAMSGLDSSLKETAKKRITKTLIGLILLLLSGAFLRIVAPWAYS